MIRGGVGGDCEEMIGEGGTLTRLWHAACGWMQVAVGDYDELRIPQEAHRIQRSASERLDQVD